MNRSKKKLRADEALVGSGLVESRSKAQALIMAGEVRFRLCDAKKQSYSQWQAIPKAGYALPESGVEFQILSSTHKDVGRGATKLRRAFEIWPEIEVENSLALDVGSSTGGFTQVMLEKGARQVVALDVGTHQLHERLRQDKRVISVEKQHVLKVEENLWSILGVELPFDLIVTDLSFISLTKIIPTVSQWLKPEGSWVLLVKPQFEVGPKKAPGGVVKDPQYQQEAIEIVRCTVESSRNLSWRDIQPSPILGGDGNKEFLLWLKKCA